MSFPNEHVLVVPTLLFHELGYFQGFQSNVKPYLSTLLDPSFVSYRLRDDVEHDPSYKQLIPYCIFRHGDRILHYARGTSSGEGRLHDKRSIGIGGHISAEDAEQGSNVYDVAMKREIDEEVELATGYTSRCVGLINDDETDVGRVHLGIVHIFEVDAPKVQPREESIKRVGFARPSELVDEIDRFETWSQICLRALFGGR